MVHPNDYPTRDVGYHAIILDTELSVVLPSSSPYTQVILDILWWSLNIDIQR